MLTYWDILTGLTVLELVLAIILAALVARLLRKPLGFRLVLLATVFITQSILGIIIYNQWRTQGYGATIAAPLIALQLTIIAGLLVIIDITRY